MERSSRRMTTRLPRIHQVVRLPQSTSYLMTHKKDRTFLWDAKAIPEDEAVSQHHLILADMKVKGAVKAQREKLSPRRKCGS